MAGEGTKGKVEQVEEGKGVNGRKDPEKNAYRGV